MPLRSYAKVLLGRSVERLEPPPGASQTAPGQTGADVPHGAAWLVQLRWVATAGQLITIAVVHWGLRVEVPLGALLTVVAVTAGSNLALAGWSAARPESQGPFARPEGPPCDDTPTVPILGLVMLLDLILLTALLYFTGGPANPFFIFYFVNLCLNAVVLPRGWAWAGNAVAVGCFALLFATHRGLPALGASAPLAWDAPTEHLTLAQWGLLAAFGTCSSVVVHFTSLLRDQLQQRERQLRAFHAERARTHKLEALGTLAAGAAHELANPLGTIAVVAREVERRVIGTAAEPRVARDIALIRSELNTCRGILQRMSADAGQAMGEELVEVSPQELIEETLEGLRQSERVTVQISPAAAALAPRLPLVGLAQALRGVVQNALAASATVQRVFIAAEHVAAEHTGPESRTADAVSGPQRDGLLRLTVRDEGVGMSPRVLARVGDPFFTTKEPGNGTGLGVFLARAVVERLSGRLVIESAAGRGTTVTILLPVASHFRSGSL